MDDPIQTNFNPLVSALQKICLYLKIMSEKGRGRPPKDPSGKTGFEIQQDKKLSDKIKDAHDQERLRLTNIKELGADGWDTRVQKNPHFMFKAMAEQQTLPTVPYMCEKHKASPGGYQCYFFDEDLVVKIVTHANCITGNQYKFTVWEYYSFMAVRMWFHAKGCTKLTENATVIVDFDEVDNDDTDAGDGIDSDAEDENGQPVGVWAAARQALGPLALNRRRFHQYHCHCVTATAIIHVEFSRRFAKFVIPAGIVVCDEKKVKVKLSSSNVIMKGSDPCLWTTEWVTPLPE